jgi:predicted flavoprotein YhiN
MGATGFAYDVARRFGLGVTEQLPGLVPLKATPATLGFLAGVSLEAIVSCAGQSFRERFIISNSPDVYARRLAAFRQGLGKGSGGNNV